MQQEKVKERTASPNTTNSMMSHSDTICALATATGGALGIIRISGPQAFGAVSAITAIHCAECEGNTLHYTCVKDGTETVDECMVSVFKAPHSYTGEDSVEICCHGSRYILNKVLELLIQNGCRMAGPGEFTQRAYLNGKMDLSQAEAVADLIASSNQATHHLAMSQLRGHFSSELAQLRAQLLKLTSLLELELDFSDHEDLEFADRTELDKLAKNINKHISKLIHSFETGQALKQGIPVAIIGKTNVGKSTLLNRLLKDDRAIVSDIHGTTRDTIEDTIDIKGVTFRFIDTAGIRQTSDEVEKIGIGRTYSAMEKARIILWIIDEKPTNEEINEIIHQTGNKKVIVVMNKSDLNESQSFTIADFPIISISAKLDTNIDALETVIYETAGIPTLADSDIIVTNARHYDALTRAQESLNRVISSLQAQVPGDLVAEDLRQVLSELSEITGEGQITPNEVLGNIFKNFCVGK
jgi:tRNA modification GTPase